jgi:hypothetical protein
MRSLSNVERLLAESEVVHVPRRRAAERASDPGRGAVRAEELDAEGRIRGDGDGRLLREDLPRREGLHEPRGASSSSPMVTA